MNDQFKRFENTGPEERLNHREIRVWGKDIFSFEDDFKNDVIIFPTVGGTHVPVEPWPTRFIISKEYKDDGFFIVRKITFWYLLVMAFQNLVTTSLNFIKLIFFKMGYLNTQAPFEKLTFKHFTWKAMMTRRSRMKIFNSVQISYASILATMEVTKRMGIKKKSGPRDLGNENACVDEE